MKLFKFYFANHFANIRSNPRSALRPQYEGVTGSGSGPGLSWPSWSKCVLGLGVLCSRHRTALDLCGLIIILLLCVVLIFILCFLHPCLFCYENSRQKTLSEPSSGSIQGPGQPGRVCLSPECVQTAASLLGAMDRTVDPCHDFFEFACGSWNKRHVIPEDRSSVSTFEVLADQLQIILKTLLESPKEKDDSQISQESKHLYQSCVNITQIVYIGDEPLRQGLSDLGGWPLTFLDSDWTPPGSLEVTIAKIRKKFNTGVLVDLWVGPDDRDSEVNVIQIDQPQLGLPSRDYFLQPESQRNLVAYHKYMTEVGQDVIMVIIIILRRIIGRCRHCYRNTLAYNGRELSRINTLQTLMPCHHPHQTNL